MNRPLAALATLAAALVITTALATDAAAQQRVVPFAEIKTVGGYTMFNDKVTFLAVTSPAGAIRKGYVVIDRDYRSQGIVQMTGALTARETYDLWIALFQAAPWRYTQVWAAEQNTDFPDTDVTYLGRYRQRIRRGELSPQAIPAGAPRLSRSMARFEQMAWAAARTVAQSDLLVYEARGGRLGYERVVRISQDGTIHDDVSYANGSATAQPYSHDGRLDAAQVNLLKRLVNAAGWQRLRDFPGQPSAVDGIDEQATFSSFGAARTVFGGEPSARTRAYQAVLDEVIRLADAL